MSIFDTDFKQKAREQLEKLLMKKFKKIAKEHNYRDSKGKLIIPKIVWK